MNRIGSLPDEESSIPRSQTESARRGKAENSAVLGLAERCLMPIEAAAFPLVRLAERLFNSGYLRSLHDQLQLRRAFRPRWTKQSLRLALRLVEATDRVLTHAGISYLACAGTLLGIQRHGGVIPWDDDLDLCLSGEDLSRFLDLRESFRTEGIEIVAANGCYKLFWADQRAIDAQMAWSWPFLDLFVWDRVGPRIVFRHFGDHYPFASLYPAKRAPFHHLELPVPREPESVLASWYGPDFMSCALSPNYSHRREKIEPRRLILSIYPLPRWKRLFSRRRRPTRWLNEMLLKAAVDFLRQCGVEFWLEYGTLLGEHRGKGHLYHSEDVDLSMMEDAFPLVQGRQHLLDPAYEFYDTSFRHDGPKCGIIHRRFGGNCDFYAYRRLESGRLRICLGQAWRGTMDARDIPADLIFPLQETQIHGLAVKRPRHTREYLEHRYGYIDYPAVRKNDGSGHYRSVWKQPSLEEEAAERQSTTKFDIVPAS